MRVSGSAMDGSTCNTCWMRSADALARGIMMNIMTAIITDIRICMM
ncbi:MAG: hypothetical protein BWY92_01624 [Firmicutes bacterium ADurb.BinA052]|nr:MAG: hypothetical protein BWY92_01624 [Firmicutes bacterium ADurb.BinA052]